MRTSHLSSCRLRRLGNGIAALVLMLWCAVPLARAQMPKVFVSLAGNDGSAGTSTSPKRTFQAAHDAVAAGGEIVVLSTAGYGALTITKSLTITVPTGANGFVTVSGSFNNGITVAAGVNDNVAIRGLTIEGDSDLNASSGIAFSSGGQLTIENCTIRSFGVGLSVSTADSSKSMVVRASVIRDCGTGTSNVASGAGNTNTVVLDGVTLNHCSTGLFANSNTGAAITTLVGCTVHACNKGIEAGLGAVNFVDGCTVSGCNTGVLADTNGVTPNGINYTRGNNSFTLNTTNGSFNGTVFAQ